MAAPAEVTVKNLSGKYVMNKSLSDDSDAILQLQGVSWVTRKAISVATVTLHVNVTPSSTPNSGGDEIKIIQVLTGGIKGSTETRVLDFGTRSHVDHVFGSVEGQSRYLDDLSSFGTSDILTRDSDGADIDTEDVRVLTAATLADGSTPSKWENASGPWIQSYVINKEAGWTAEQVWGFEEVEGLRRYTRRVVVRKQGGKGGVIRARLVYDYKGPVEIKE